MEQLGRKKMLSFGLIADTQYVDDEDGSNFDGSRIRRYRQSLDMINKAAYHFKAEPLMQFCVLLGDVLDMRCRGNPELASDCLDKILRATEIVTVPWHFVVGNHDLHCFSRESLYENYIPSIPEKVSCSPSKMYYSFKYPSAERFRFIILDAYDSCWIQPSTPEQKRESIDLLLSKNPNLSYFPDVDEWSRTDWCSGLSNSKLRFNPAGGAIGLQQLAWLDDLLHEAHAHGERCLVFCHVPCHMPSTLFPECLLWNSEDLLAVMHKYHGTVVAYFAGHDHTGGHSVDDGGICHMIPPAPIECGLDTVSYGVLHVMDDDSIEVEWVGHTPPDEYFMPWPERLHTQPSATK